MKRREIIIIFSVLLLGIAVTLILAFASPNVSYVIIEVDNELYAALPLSENTQLRIESEKGYNILLIEDEQVYITESDCPGKDCIRKGAINEKLSTDVIYCAPHGVTVYLSKEKP